MEVQQDQDRAGAAFQRHKKELLLQNYTDPSFSILSVCQACQDLPISPQGIAALLRFHYGLIQSQDPNLTVSAYLKRFPHHQRWEEELRLINDCTQLVTVAQSAPKQTIHRMGEGIEEFSCSPLGRLPPGLQMELRSLMSVQKYRRGELIVREGDIGDRLMVVTSGMIQIITQQTSPDPTVIGAVVVGDVLGEMSLIGNRPCTASAIAVSEVELLSLPACDFHRLRQAHPELAHLITEIVANRLGNEQHDALSRKSLNGYIIHRRLGRGGMSIVYDAVRESDGLRVALKMMSHRLVYDERSRTLFDSEAAIISSFEHPNIPRIYERFDNFGTSFMAIEYVEGIPLSTIVKHLGPLDESLLLSILGQLARALNYAHSAGVVHRDIKPSNCLLTQDGSAKLMDFGLSIRFDNGPQGYGGLMGTPAYMAPEQVAGEPPQPAADWFSLGLTVFELATGERLLHPSNFFALSDMFSNWNPDEYAGRIRDAILREFVARSLQKDPSKRNVDIPRLIALKQKPEIRFLKEMIQLFNDPDMEETKTLTITPDNYDPGA